MRKLLMAVAFALAALVAGPGAEAQPRDTLIVGMALEPPHLDPTAGAAAAIREVVYANLFEGLVRMDGAGAIRSAHRWRARSSRACIAASASRRARRAATSARTWTHPAGASSC